MYFMFSDQQPALGSPTECSCGCGCDDGGSCFSNSIFSAFDNADRYDKNAEPDYILASAGECPPYSAILQYLDLNDFALSVTCTMQRFYEHNDHITIRTFDIALLCPSSDFLELAKEREETITMVQYTEWPDMSVPSSVDDMYDLFEVVDSLQHGEVEGIDESNDTSHESDTPICVHCIAGVGRTGTFCTIHYVWRQMKQFLVEQQLRQRSDGVRFKFDVYNVVKQLKSQRTGMVLRREQYQFCYEAILKISQRLQLQ